MKVDLSRLPAGQPIQVNAHVGMGRLEIDVPRDAKVALTTHVKAGDIEALGIHDDGRNARVETGAEVCCGSTPRSAPATSRSCGPPSDPDPDPLLRAARARPHRCRSLRRHRGRARRRSEAGAARVRAALARRWSRDPPLLRPVALVGRPPPHGRRPPPGAGGDDTPRRPRRAVRRRARRRAPHRRARAARPARRDPPAGRQVLHPRDRARNGRRGRDARPLRLFPALRRPGRARRRARPHRRPVGLAARRRTETSASGSQSAPRWPPGSTTRSCRRWRSCSATRTTVPAFARSRAGRSASSAAGSTDAATTVRPPSPTRSPKPSPTSRKHTSSRIELATSGDAPVDDALGELVLARARRWSTQRSTRRATTSPSTRRSSRPPSPSLVRDAVSASTRTRSRSRSTRDRRLDRVARAPRRWIRDDHHVARERDKRSSSTMPKGGTS